MALKVRSLSRLLVLGAAVWLAGDTTAARPTASSSAPGDSPAVVAAEEMAALLRPQVRIRKLHLVRPDLIPYPLAYEVLC